MRDMLLKKIFNVLPKLPLTALVFYTLTYFLWNFDMIPRPSEIFFLLERLYDQYGLIGLSVAAFLEGIVYIGLYFGGIAIILLSVILSDGTFLSLITISVVVAIALTLASLLNYFIGMNISLKNRQKFLKNMPIKSKSLILACIHPNILAFYFFNSGLKKENILKALLIPLIIIPYGFVLALIFSTFKEPIKSQFDNAPKIIFFIILWFAIALILKISENQNKTEKYDFLRNKKN